MIQRGMVVAVLVGLCLAAGCAQIWTQVDTPQGTVQRATTYELAPVQIYGAGQGAQLFFPNHGTLNALIVFVQHRDDTYDNELTTDPQTEWPAARGLEAPHRLPAWAGRDGMQMLAPPGTAPENFADGSLSQFYYQMSGGRQVLTGAVYPRVYVPKHTRKWYVDHRGDLPNGAIKLSHEVLTSSEVQGFIDEAYPGEAIRIFDRYTNGTNTLQPDGTFDLIVLVYRLSHLQRLIDGCGLSDKTGALQDCRRKGFTGITSLGSYGSGHGDTFGDSGHPVRLGGLKVIDNNRSGSGVIGEGLTKKAAVRMIGHEVGHRQFYYQHTCYDQDAATARADCIGIMSGPALTFSAPERIKLGWADVDTVDISSFSGARRYQLADAIGPRPGSVLRITYGEPRCGDLIVEARTWSNFWDRPPNGTNDDGDNGDFFLPQEGLYLYKASDGTSGCGGSNYLFSSLENTRGKPRDPTHGFRYTQPYHTAFTAGESYTPATTFPFRYHAHPTLDARLTLIDIVRTDQGFSFTIWSNDPAAGNPSD